jgi:transposase InsO family protein
MRRKESELIAERNSPVVERIKTLKAEHPFWGYRRIWANLKYIDELEINKKRVLRLLQKHDLLVKPNIKLKAIRMPTKSKPKPHRPNQWWGIDMTKVMVQGFGWMYIVVVLDWYTKKIVGYYAGMECKSRHWLEALNMAVNNQFRDGVREQRLFLMSDNGSQPTSMSFMKACREMEINQAFTSYNNPKGNADTERVFRTMKEELLWLREWTSLFELVDALSNWVAYYNTNYLHSALGYKTPIKFEEEYHNSQATLLVMA